jgi:type III restriction enzyme
MEALTMNTLKTEKNSWVQKTPGVCGGNACIRNTRITVWGLVNSRRLGASDDNLLKDIVGLTPEDLRAAWEYYEAHPSEIDRNIRENEED